MSRYHCTFKNFIMRQQKRLKHLYQEIETSMCAGLSLAQPSDDISARGLRADRLPCDDEAKSKKKYRESNQSCPGYQPGRPQGLLSRPCPLCALGPSLLQLAQPPPSLAPVRAPPPPSVQLVELVSYNHLEMLRRT